MFLIPPCAFPTRQNVYCETGLFNIKTVTVKLMWHVTVTVEQANLNFTGC